MRLSKLVSNNLQIVANTMFSSVILLSIIAILIDVYSGEKVRYIATERPNITYLNTDYISYYNLTSRRYNRRDPFYYINVKAYSVYEFHNNVSVHFYFYEFLSNRYRRGFVEMHFLMCDLVEKGLFFGMPIGQGKLKNGCPFPAGKYSINNVTFPVKNIPHNFPFKKGRIYCNFTKTDSNEVIGSGHIDMEIKEAHI